MRQPFTVARPRKAAERMGESMKLTPWFPAHVEPVYPGPYEVKLPNLVWYRKWDGKRWYCGGPTPDMAVRMTVPFRSIEPPELWRGLAEPPKGWKK